MRNLKTIIILLFVNIALLYSQNEYYCIPKERMEITTNPKKPINREFPQKLNTEFDWTIDSIKFKWLRRENAFLVMDTVKIAMPFFQYNNPRNYELLADRDIYPEDGWELIRYGGDFVFGDSSDYYLDGWPYFVLYNKYTGILRKFILLEPNEKDKYEYLINFVCQFGDIYGNSLVSSIADNIQPQNSLDNLGESTQMFFYPFSEESKLWNWGDLLTTYDPCSCQHDNLMWIITNLLRYREVIIDGKKGIEYSNLQFGSASFALPGFDLVNSEHSKDAIDAWYPLYNNILGTFNLLRTPEIKYSSQFNTDYQYQFKLDKEIEFVLNPNAGFYMDSTNLYAQYVVEFSKNPDLNFDENLIKINDSTYESFKIPIGCFKDFTFRFSSPFREPPKKVFIELSGEFIKINKNGHTSSQYLELSFNANLNNRNELEFNNPEWENNYIGLCDKIVHPFNIDNEKIEDFCNGDDYYIKDRYYPERKTRKLIDSVEKVSKQIQETRLYDIYPNPANSLLNIDYSVVEQSDIKLYIIDLLGNIVAKTDITGRKLRGKHNLEMNISHLAQGFYIVIFETNSIKDSRKLVVLR